jgi:hypothetical protein
VLFDGKDLSHWVSAKGGEAKWIVANGAVTVNGTGSIMTKEEFGAVQLHLEWATPVEVQGKGQERGNSGVYLQGRYEIQVLDCYSNKTYADGATGGLYGQHPALANACTIVRVRTVTCVAIGRGEVPGRRVACRRVG